MRTNEDENENDPPYLYTSASHWRRLAVSPTTIELEFEKLFWRSANGSFTFRSVIEKSKQKRKKVSKESKQDHKKLSTEAL